MAEERYRVDGRLRPIVLVKSCQRFHDRQNACRATWAGELSRQGIPLWFVEGGHKQTEINLCWILLPGGDRYSDNSFKVRDALGLLLEHDPFDSVFVCDDDTFVHPRRWLAFTPTGQFCGLKTEAIPWVHGGGGWWMSRAACAAYVAGIKRRCSWDDRLCTEILEPAGFTFENRPDLFAQWDERVSANNSLITCHHVSESEMPELFKATYDL